MGFWNDVMEGAAAQFDHELKQAQGARLVRDCVNYRPERARVIISKAVAEAFTTENGALLLGMLNEFGEQMKQAESLAFQGEVSELLWFFKQQVAGNLAEGETIDSSTP